MSNLFRHFFLLFIFLPITMSLIPIPQEFTRFMMECMFSFKCSAHDTSHVYRVASLALKIAETENNVNKKVVYIASLCHDILDSKLVSVDNLSSMEEKLKSQLLTFVSLDEFDAIQSIIKSVGYRKMLHPDFNAHSRSVEYRCVQDADLLDAIGMIGVSRCYSFGGGRNRDLFGLSNLKTVITTDDYITQSENSSNLQHFFDKLLRIKGMVITKEGKKLAVDRHRSMVEFMKNLSIELIDAGSEDGIILRDLLPREEIVNVI